MVRMKWLSTALGNHSHIEPRRGTRDEARAYCMKADTKIKGPWEYGNWIAGGQGKRNDLLEVADLVADGAGCATIAREFPVQYIKYHRGISKLVQMHVEVRVTPPKVVLCYGKTGTGMASSSTSQWNN